MSEAVRHQLLITLVHGTWGRGFFLRRQRQGHPPLWFEEGSPFLARLSAELGDIPHKTNPLLWSGANSIFERDKTAQVLAGHLSAEHTEYPQATQLIVAHSHGGNIALRALHHLQERDAPELDGDERAKPFVVTLATPFIEIHRANFGRRPLLIRLSLMFAMGFLSVALSMALLIFLLYFLFPRLPDPYVAPILVIWEAVMVLLIAIFGWWWIVGRAATRQGQIEALRDATRLEESASAQRLLVVRAIDDEASLALALGTIFNFLTARFITYVFFLFFMTPVLLIFSRWFPNWAYAAALAGFIILTGMLFLALMVSRLVHGRELAISPMECQINTQSAPDAADLSRIVTLVSHHNIKSLRHGIYEHENCAKAISDWMRSQLGAPR